MISGKKLEANRRNAGLSTGPRTIDGKATSSRNSTKAGIWSKLILIGDEDPKEMKRERERLFASLEPEGSLEQACVERIFELLWRRRRVACAEAGEINGATIKRVDKLRLARQARARELLATLDDDVLEPDTRAEALDELSTMSAGIANFSQRLKRAIVEVETNGVLSEDTADDLEGPFGGALATRCARLSQKIANADGNEAAREKFTKKLMALLGKRQTRLQGRYRKVQRREHRALEAAQQAASLPPAQRSDLILRYGTTLDRQVLRWIRELERLQAARRARTGANGTDQDV